jgi:hypothetical protein
MNRWHIWQNVDAGGLETLNINLLGISMDDAGWWAIYRRARNVGRFHICYYCSINCHILAFNWKFFLFFFSNQDAKFLIVTILFTIGGVISKSIVDSLAQAYILIFQLAGVKNAIELWIGHSQFDCKYAISCLSISHKTALALTHK